MAAKRVSDYQSAVSLARNHPLVFREMLQRRLKIGRNEADVLIGLLVADGVLEKPVSGGRFRSRIFEPGENAIYLEQDESIFNLPVDCLAKLADETGRYKYYLMNGDNVFVTSLNAKTDVRVDDDFEPFCEGDTFFMFDATGIAFVGEMTGSIGRWEEPRQRECNPYSIKLKACYNLFPQISEKELKAITGGCDLLAESLAGMSSVSGQALIDFIASRGRVTPSDFRVCMECL